MAFHRPLRSVLGALACWAAAMGASPGAAAQCRIEPFGDSITAGVGSTSPNPSLAFSRGQGYRGWLTLAPPVVGMQLVGARDDLIAETYPTLSYGPLTDVGTGPLAFPFFVQRFHSGVPGWRIDELQIAADTNYLVKPSGPPNLVLVHAGTNDLFNQAGAPLAAARLRLLLGSLARKYPSPVTKILVAQIVPFGGALGPALNPVVNNFNRGTFSATGALLAPGVAQIVTEVNAAFGPRFFVVDMNTGFPPTYLTPDGIHPNDAGYGWMAAQWAVMIKFVAPSAGCVPT